MTSLLKSITSLRLGQTRYGKAPHKPILLLAVIDGFEKGYLSEPMVPISPELLTSFHDYWKLLVHTPHVPTFSLPFFHLGSEPSGIWQLHTMPGKTIPLTKSNSIKSFKALQATVQAAQLSEELFQALCLPVQRAELRLAILSRYFPNADQRITENYQTTSNSIKSEILYDPGENYARKIVQRLKDLKPIEREEEIVVRSHIFKKAVLELYDHRCAISGLKIETPKNISMVDACHIIPFAESYDDTISNGIALAPTLHRAFDRGLLTISENYKVIVHPQVKDYSPSNGIQQFNHKEIFLPNDSRFFPSPQKLKEHWTRFSFSM
ncbi:HNH endonuclease [Sunxiuqinia rutila]|uniref:HNH endonuclease n=1 Tax=Sunxiuqinia rutila TaxID=1397841 RepID=UPI003D36CEBC